MPALEYHIVPVGTPKARLSDYTAGRFARIPSRKGMKKAIKRGEVLLNGRVGQTGDWVEPGDRIELMENPKRLPAVYEYPLEVMYQDNHLAVVIKPVELLTSGNQHRTLAHALPFCISRSPEADAYHHPRPVHRLDRATSGLLLVARTRCAHQALDDLFQKRAIHKTYTAIAMGNCPDTARICLPLEEKPATTLFQILEKSRSLKNDWLSLVQLQPVTGRTHQLRRHLAAIDHAILGDSLYSPPHLCLRGKGLFLCATGLHFTHPVTRKPLHFTLPPPPKFFTLLRREQRRWDRYH